MSYVGEPFVHDVFVSYSHGDVDGSDNSKLKQWSHTFARELEAELRAYPQLAQSLSVFLDQDHRPGQGVDPLSALSDGLKASIELSALLAVVMTPHYLASEWCGRERDWWIEGQNAHRLLTTGRLAVVHAWPTPTPWPPVFNDSLGEPLTGFVFHNPAEGPQPFGWPGTAKDEFSAQLLNLVRRLVDKLQDVRKELDLRRRREAESARLKEPTGQALYLHARAEHAESWKRVCDMLQQAGFGVFPSEPEHVGHNLVRSVDAQRARVALLSECDALLLVGANDGMALDADLASIGRSTRQLARDRSGRLLPCAVLDVGGVGLDRRRRNAHNLGIDWIDATDDPWNPELPAWLSHKAVQAEAT